MSTVITTNTGTQYKKPGAGETCLAVVTGATAGGMVSQLQSGLAPIIPRMQGLNKNIDTVQLKGSIDKAFAHTGLADNHGVKFFDFSGSAPKSTKEVVRGAFNKFSSKIDELAKTKDGSFTKNVAKAAKQFINDYILGEIKAGNNAAFHSKKNSVLVNVERIGTSAFHEIGHAINYNNSKFWKGVQKLRGAGMVLPGVILLVGLSKRKKAQGEEPKNAFDKVTDDIKNNAGKLSFLTMLPTVTEETMASIRGNKLAKKFCSPEIYKKVVKSNVYGGLTYVAAAVITGLSAYVAIKVRDAIAKPKEIQQS